MTAAEELVTVAQATGPNGEIVLRRRGTGEDAVVELIVNGAFAMDSAETSTERALARLPFPYAGARVLLGGLGLGYTADELVRHGVASVDVAEIEPALVQWACDGVTPVLARVAGDPRVRLHIADVAAVVADPSTSWDAVLLDVDNGPDFLIHAGNAGLYTAAGVGLAYERLVPGGMLAIWCQGPVPELLSTLRAVDGSATEHRYEVQRGQRSFAYVIYTVRRPVPGRAQ